MSMLVNSLTTTLTMNGPVNTLALGLTSACIKNTLTMLNLPVLSMTTMTPFEPMGVTLQAVVTELIIALHLALP